MANLARALESSVVDSYRAAIEEHVKESQYTDALEKLIDFVRDCSPGDRRDAVSLYARYTRWKSAERRGVSHNENINEVIQAILEMADLIASRAHIADEVALNAADLDAPQGNIIIMPDATADVPLADRLSEDRVKSDLSHRKLDQVLQTYVDVWRSTRKRPDDTLVVQARDLVKEFPRTGFLLGPVSFDLIAGEIIGVIGMNASGKTTLLRLLLERLPQARARSPIPSSPPDAETGCRSEIRLDMLPRCPKDGTAG